MQEPTHPNIEAADVNMGPAPTEEGVPDMFCTQCGVRNGGDAKFCKQCGNKLDRTVPLRISEEEFLLPESRDEQVKGLLLAAYKKYEAEDLVGAIAVCLEALAIRPDSTDANSLVSTLYEKVGDRERAVEARERVLALNPGSIADREKLDELKHGLPTVTPKKITTSRRPSSSPLIESPAAQALAALCVMLIVLGIGAALLWSGRSKRDQLVGPEAKLAAPTPFSNPAQVPPGGQPMGSQNQSQQGSGDASRVNPMAGSLMGVQNQPPNPMSNFGDAFGGQRTARVDPFANNPLSAREIAPAPVNPLIDSTGGRLGQGAVPDRGAIPSRPRNTVRLDDTDQDGSQGSGSESTSNPPNIASSSPPGKMEFIVSPSPGQGASGSVVGRSAPGPEAGSLYSRSALEVARDLHSKSQYAKAVTFYKKALDGAGEVAGDIHQKIGLCYQRLNDKENAIQHYQHGIEVYKTQMTSGKNVEGARNGIRACETGIKVCQ